MEQPDIRQMRILVVDDQESNVALLQDLLEQGGYTTVSAITDPRETVATFTTLRPDLLLLDLLMPHLDGFQVMAHLRPLMGEGAFLPILVLTADIDNDVKRRALAEGATDFLTKPFDGVEVLLRIENLLRARSLHLQLQDQNDLLDQRVRQRTRELEEARGEVLALYQELARRNRSLHERVERLIETYEQPGARRSTAGDVAPEVERLTAREREVLRLLAGGQTNKEIARSLVVSLATVKSHVEHIIAKLGVADRTQAAVRAVEMGLLGD